MDRPRFLLIGIDGADYAIVRRFMDEGLLPRLGAIAEAGAWGPARSTVPPVTPPAWTTMMTGKNPGRHGVFDFVPMTSDALDTPIAARRKAMTVWRALSDRGYRVGTFNLPGTYPPEELSAFQISGFDAPALGPEMARPDGMFEVLRERVGEYDLFPASIQSPEGDAEALERHGRLPVLAAKALLTARPCDVAMVSFQIADWAQHGHLGREMTPGDVGSLRTDGIVAQAYRLVDENVGALLDEWTDDKTTVMVVSDHGAAAVDRLVNLEKLFLDAGLLAYTSPEAEGAGAVEASRSRARLALRGWTALKRWAPWAARLLGGAARSARGKLTEYQHAMRVDWSRTQAAPWGDYGQIKLNPSGAEKEALASQVTELLLSVRDPSTEEAIFAQVLRGEDVYTGPYVSDGADLIAVPREARYFSVSARSGAGGLPMLDLQQETVAVLSPAWGVHCPVGILMLAGPEVQTGAVLESASLLDFVPTLLYLMGEPIPADIEGHPLLEGVVPDVKERRPPEGCEPWPEPASGKAHGSYSEAEQAAVEERLRDLGYL